MAVAATVAAVGCSQWGSARGEVDRVMRRWDGRGEPLPPRRLASTRQRCSRPHPLRIRLKSW